MLVGLPSTLPTAQMEFYMADKYRGRRQKYWQSRVKVMRLYPTTQTTPPCRLTPLDPASTNNHERP